MPDLAQHQLMAWLSPSYPIGAFSYSHGLEYATEAGDVNTASELQDWLTDILEHGSGWNDALLLAHAHKAQDATELEELSDLALALCASKERHLETLAQGKAFAKVTSQVWAIDLPKAPHPIVVGWAASCKNIKLEHILPLYLHSFASNIISAGIRFIPLGQTEGQQVLAALFPLFDRLAMKAISADLDDLGSIAFLADIASMQHETMTTRIFRT